MQDPLMKAPHDIGGDDAGPIDTSDHPKTIWEKRIDAIVSVLNRKLIRTDEGRRGREMLGGELYRSLSYSERIIATTAQLLLEKGVITSAELADKLEEIALRAHA